MRRRMSNQINIVNKVVLQRTGRFPYDKIRIRLAPVCEPRPGPKTLGPVTVHHPAG